MLRFLHKQAVEDVRRLLLSGEGCITRCCRPKQRQRVKCRRLVIIGIAARQILHGLLVSEGARAVIDPAEIARSEEHTSELQSPCNLVCRLLLEKKKENKSPDPTFLQARHNALGRPD